MPCVQLSSVRVIIRGHHSVIKRVVWEKGASERISPLTLYFSTSTDPSVCPFRTSSPIPQRPTCSGPGGRRPPGQRRPLAARRTVGGRRRLGDASLVAGVLASPGRRPCLPGPLSPPLSYIPQPCNHQWSERAERASIQQTNKKFYITFQLCSHIRESRR